VAWAFVRPSDPSVLEGRPLLDLGTGDGQTVAALAPDGLVVGVDRSFPLLRPGNVNALVDALPFRDASFRTVLAADVVHHVSAAELSRVVDEVVRVLRPGGRFVAWWLEDTADTAPDAPLFTRGYEEVALIASAAGLDPAPLAVDVAAPNSATVGLVATR
jgi:SAM-dependent methyltransferase